MSRQYCHGYNIIQEYQKASSHNVLVLSLLLPNLSLTHYALYGFMSVMPATGIAMGYFGEFFRHSVYVYVDGACQGHICSAGFHRGILVS